MDNFRLYTVALSHCSAVGPVHFRKLIAAFRTAELAWNASPAALLQAGFSEKFIAEYCSERTSISPKQAFQRMCNEGVRAVLQTEPDYPQTLNDLYDSPYVLFYRGVLPTSNERMLAVIGTRRCSSYGAHTTALFVKECVQNECVIVSGLALGIDALAHRATLDAHGRTIAVLGGGVDRNTIGPRQNTLLAEEIIQAGGCVLSEYPVGMAGLHWHFPMRNRIVAALSAGVLVVEAPLKSGALITADIALNINREVFAIPGNITSALSQGANFLIQNGAHIALAPRDVIETLGFHAGDKKKLEAESSKEILTDLEQNIVSILGVRSLHVEEISHQCNLDMATTNSTLVLMEIKGFVTHLGGMNYKLS
ncbi:MAG: DNA-processing protein DprA [bacterium]|nr:DNA-processing protein DprA [bacterium]